MKTFVIANWKCNPTTQEGAGRLFTALAGGLSNFGVKAEVVVCPPFVYLPKLVDFLSVRARSQLKLGAQDLFWENKGAYTGEVSAAMLKDLGCKYVIVGHSERRQHFGETDEMVNKKIKAAISTKLIPILCVGESAPQRESGKMGKVLKTQIFAAFKNISSSKFQDSRPVLAYEPLWAIGSGKACSPDEAMGAAIFLRKCLGQLYGRSASEKTSICYGGSVNSKNAADYITQARLQGLLVGGASLDSKEFIKIVRRVVE